MLNFQIIYQEGNIKLRTDIGILCTIASRMFNSGFNCSSYIIMQQITG